MCELNEVLFSYFILKTIKQKQKQLISMSVNSDEELMDYYSSRRMSTNELREFLETAKAKKGGDIDIYVSSAKPRDPNRPPKQCAKLGSEGNDEAQPNASEQEAEPTAAWGWLHQRTVVPQPVKGPEPPAGVQEGTSTPNVERMTID